MLMLMLQIRHGGCQGAGPAYDSQCPRSSVSLPFAHSKPRGETFHLVLARAYIGRERIADPHPASTMLVCNTYVTCCWRRHLADLCRTAPTLQGSTVRQADIPGGRVVPPSGTWYGLA